jgi:hypothetical protein
MAVELGYYWLELTINTFFYTILFSSSLAVIVVGVINTIKFIARGAKLPSDWRKRNYLWVQVVIGTLIIDFLVFLVLFSGIYIV